MAHDLVGYTFPTAEIEYSRKDAVLYALAIGMGKDPISKRELSYLYEDAEDFHIFSTFSAALAFEFLPNVGTWPGLSFDRMQLLHGEHHLEIHQPLPNSGSLKQQGEVIEVWDKGSGMLLVVRVISKDQSGQLVAVNDYTLFIRGLGNFGGERGPERIPVDYPKRAADAVIEETTLPQQALLYSLTGDRNPLHIDPDRAKQGGFERPILQGLCTVGYATRAVLGTFGDMDSTLLKSLNVRLSAPVWPGETLKTSCWVEGETIFFLTTAVERDVVVLDQAFCTLSPR